jgi:hypothetical protein
VILPGARGYADPGYDPLVDGCTARTDDPLCAGARAQPLTNPLTGQRFPNEMAALSYNFATFLAGFSKGGMEPVDPNDPACADPTDPACPMQPSDPDCDLDSLEGLFRCDFVRGVFAVAGTQRPEMRAGGNGTFGRRDFLWAGGSELEIRYPKRNVLGFATDFAHDRTGTNWSVEATWVAGQPYAIATETRGWGRRDTYNLTLSVDRPSFIRYLNPGRTFFLNLQLFVRYIVDYEDRDAMGVNGPLAALSTFSIATGYHQDRLIPGVTWVHDWRSASGGLVGQLSFRFTQDFSATIGSAAFYGKPDDGQIPFRQALVGNSGGDFTTQNRYDGLSALAERDEIYLILRYTF